MLTDVNTVDGTATFKTIGWPLVVVKTVMLLSESKSTIHSLRINVSVEVNSTAFTLTGRSAKHAAAAGSKSLMKLLKSAESAGHFDRMTLYVASRAWLSYCPSICIPFIVVAAGAA